MKASMILFVLFFVITAPAEVINVPEEFETIQAGIDEAEDGDTVLVAPGEYVENLSIEGKTIQLIGDRDDPSAVVIDGSEGGDHGSVIITQANPNYNSSITIAGLTLCNGIGTVGQFGRMGGAIYSSDDGDNRPSIEDCIIRDNDAYDGAAYFGMRAIPILLRTKFYNNTSRGGVAGCSVVTIAYSGIRDDEPFMSYCLFEGNSSARSLITSLHNGVSPLTIEHCTFVSNDCSGSLLEAGNSRTIITNTIIWDNGSNLVLGSDDDQRYMLTVLYSNIQGGEGSLQRGAIAGDGLLNSDPIFLDPDEGDYHLTEDSPCIDASDPGSPEDPDGTRSDMGAFYFHQRDIDVSPLEIEFPPTFFGELDSLPVEIKNEGNNLLSLTMISGCECMSCIWPQELSPDDPPIEIEPDSSHILWVYFRPDPDAVMSRSILISSDDPDEPEVIVEATGSMQDVKDDDDISPGEFSLSTFPNPFNSTTTINYFLPQTQIVTIQLYDMSGRLIETLNDNIQTAGNHSIVWDSREFGSGIYLVQIQSETETRTAKLVAIK